MTITREEIDEIVNALAVPPGDNGRVSLPGDGMKRLFEIAGHAIYEQSRIDAAVAKERERCVDAVRSVALAMLAEWTAHPTADDHEQDRILEARSDAASECLAVIRTPTATTEEGA